MSDLFNFTESSGGTAVDGICNEPCQHFEIFISGLLLLLLLIATLGVPDIVITLRQDNNSLSKLYDQLQCYIIETVPSA